MYKRTMKRAVVLLLLMSLTVNSVIPSNTFVQTEVKGKETTQETKKQVTEIEIPEERTETSTTYQRSDGSKRVEMFGENIRYVKNPKKKSRKADNLADYDASLVEVDKKQSEGGESLKNYVYENATGDKKHYFPERISEETPLLMEDGDYAIEMNPYKFSC